MTQLYHGLTASKLKGKVKHRLAQGGSNTAQGH